MRSLPQEAVAALPLTCRNVLRQPAADILAAAVELVRVELKYIGKSDDAMLLREIAETYAVASVRLRNQATK